MFEQSERPGYESQRHVVNNLGEEVIDYKRKTMLRRVCTQGFDYQLTRHQARGPEPYKGLEEIQDQESSLNNRQVEDDEDAFDQYILDDSESSLASLVGDDQPPTVDSYTASVMSVSQAKSEEELVDREFLNLLAYIKTLKAPADADLKKVSFGDVTRHKTLIFDLDETLLHSTPILEETQPGHFDFEISLPGAGCGVVLKYGVCIRPHAWEVVSKLSEIYEIAVFTASEQTYADAVMSKMNLNELIPTHRRLYR